MPQSDGIGIDDKSMEASREYQNEFRRTESTLELNLPLGTAIDLEKESTAETFSPISSTTSVSEPKRVKSKDESHDGGPDGADKPFAEHKIVTAQDWTGPDDPENPANWPSWKKIYHAVPCALFGFVV